LIYAGVVRIALEDESRVAETEPPIGFIGISVDLGEHLDQEANALGLRDFAPDAI
jgi:hypothetical protein